MIWLLIPYFAIGVVCAILWYKYMSRSSGEDAEYFSKKTSRPWGWIDHYAPPLAFALLYWPFGLLTIALGRFVVVPSINIAQRLIERRENRPRKDLA